MISMMNFGICMQFYVFQNQGINNTILSLREITNEEVHVKCYDSNDIVPYSLQTISQNYFKSLSPLDVPTDEHDNIISKRTVEKTFSLSNHYQ